MAKEFSPENEAQTVPKPLAKSYEITLKTMDPNEENRVFKCYHEKELSFLEMCLKKGYYKKNNHTCITPIDF